MVWGTVAAAVLSAIGTAPSAVADPVSGQSADVVIADLEDQGYDVVVNWVTGYDTKPLSDCWVRNVNDPGHAPPAEGVFSTVYVDVACPNGDDSGVTGGVGIGIG